MHKIIVVVDNVHMGLSHAGLSLLAKKLKYDPEKMAQGQLLMFMNRAKDKLKIMGGQGKVIGYLKMPKGRRIMLEAIQYIPMAFTGGEINYDAALKQALTKSLAKEVHRPSPLQVYRAEQRAGL